MMSASPALGHPSVSLSSRRFENAEIALFSERDIRDEQFGKIQPVPSSLVRGQGSKRPRRYPGILRANGTKGDLTMKAERENDLVDVLDKLLNKGLVLNADLIISVAGVPLIGVNLKAALAGIETMLDYGMMEAWDQRTREWYAKEYATKGAVPLAEGEEVILKMLGSLWDRRWISPTWRPGSFYLTNKRFFLFRKEPAEILFEIELDKLEGLMIRSDTYLRKEREELYIQFDCGETARIHVSNIRELKDAIEETVGKQLERELSIPYEQYPLPQGEKIVQTEKFWYLFPSMGILTEAWRLGRLSLTNKRLFWVYQVDNQKMFEVPFDEIIGVTLGFNGKESSISACEKVLIIAYNGGRVLFGGDENRLQKMKIAIEKMIPEKPIVMK